MHLEDLVAGDALLAGRAVQVVEQAFAVVAVQPLRQVVEAAVHAVGAVVRHPLH